MFDVARQRWPRLTVRRGARGVVVIEAEDTGWESEAQADIVNDALRRGATMGDLLHMIEEDDNAWV